MRILVTGAKGQVGAQLVTVLSTQGHEVIGYDVDDLDITQFALVERVIGELKPHLVINPAAWTDVDGCAHHPEKALQVNGYGAQNLAVASYRHNAAIMQISSNEVFDGQAKRPYYEYDTPRAINPYGYSKLVGEQAVMRTNPRHYIVRMSWLFAHGGHNFIHAILNAVRDGHQQLRVVVDEIANPTYNDDLVQAITRLIESGRYGIYHLCNAGSTSRYDFARYFLDQAGFSDVTMERISHHQWARPSTPPVYTSLANVSAKMLGIELRDWREAVDEFLERENLLSQTVSG
ncbi:MAG: dTDP-4-dehydrorhamnose reductase [Anaerolineae bacterium]